MYLNHYQEWVQTAPSHPLSRLSTLSILNSRSLSTRIQGRSIAGEKIKCWWFNIPLSSSPNDWLQLFSLLLGLAFGLACSRGNNFFICAIWCTVILLLWLSIISLLFLIVEINLHLRLFIRSANKLIHDWLTVEMSYSWSTKTLLILTVIEALLWQFSTIQQLMKLATASMIDSCILTLY